MDVQVAIIMVSHNDLNESCLKSVAKARQQSSLKTAFVVVDNASKKYHANEVVDQFCNETICLLRDKDYGFGRSCNRGAKEVEAQYYFFLNPDTVLIDLDIIDELHKYMRLYPGAGLVAPKIIYFDGRPQETFRRFPKWYMPFTQRTFLKDTEFGKNYARSFLMWDVNREKPRSVDWVQGSAMFVDGSLWKKLNGFDDRYFMYFEDIDLCRRIYKEHRTVVYYPATVLQHAHGKESAKIPSLIKNLVQNDMARAHLASWFKYVWKWRGQDLPPRPHQN